MTQDREGEADRDSPEMPRQVISGRAALCTVSSARETDRTGMR